MGLSLGVPYVSFSASVLTKTIKNKNFRPITPSLARSAHCPSLLCVLSCSEGDIVVSRLRLTALSCFRSNTSSHPETVTQGRQVSREGEGSVRIVDCLSRPPACVLSRTAVICRASSAVPFSALKVIRAAYYLQVPSSHGGDSHQNSLCRLRTIRDLATLLRISYISLSTLQANQLFDVTWSSALYNPSLFLETPRVSWNAKASLEEQVPLAIIY